MVQNENACRASSFSRLYARSFLVTEDGEDTGAIRDHPEGQLTAIKKLCFLFDRRFVRPSMINELKFCPSEHMHLQGGCLLLFFSQYLR